MHTCPSKQPQFIREFYVFDLLAVGTHVYLDPGKRGRSEKSSAIIAPIAHMSENLMRNKHILIKCTNLLS